MKLHLLKARFLHGSFSRPAPARAWFCTAERNSVGLGLTVATGGRSQGCAAGLPPGGPLSPVDSSGRRVPAGRCPWRPTATTTRSATETLPQLRKPAGGTQRVGQRGCEDAERGRFVCGQVFQSRRAATGFHHQPAEMDCPSADEAPNVDQLIFPDDAALDRFSLGTLAADEAVWSSDGLGVMDRR